tara:strand:+ start:765 stop:1400 length:636 start_codon:yes stop_codon:yes gene_type:complete
MIHELIKRKQHNLNVEQEALQHINPILKKINDVLVTAYIDAPENPSNNENLFDEHTSEDEVRKAAVRAWQGYMRNNVEVDIWDWCAMLTFNVLVDTNTKLFYAFKDIMADYGVKKYTKTNDGDSKSRRLRGKFSLFKYESFYTRDSHDYYVDVIFKGHLPDDCKIEYEEKLEEVDSDRFIVQNGKVMRKEVIAKVICADQSVLRLPEQATA